MAIYLEPVTNDDDGRFSRLRGDDLSDLDRFVDQAGIAALYVPHKTVVAMGYYRLDRKDRRRALRHGAQEVTWHDAFGRLGRLIVDGTRPPAGPDFTRFGMIRRTATAVPATPEVSVSPLVVSATTISKRGLRTRTGAAVARTFDARPPTGVEVMDLQLS